VCRTAARHVSRLRRLGGGGGGGQNLGQDLVYSTKNRILTGGATILKIGVQNNAASELFLVCTPTCDILGYIYLVANEVKKFCQMNLFGKGKKAVCEQVPPPAMCLTTTAAAAAAAAA